MRIQFEIPVIKYTLYDLSKFDFSSANIRLMDIQSDEFKQYIKDLSPQIESANYGFFKHIIEEKIHRQQDRRFAIVPDNYKEFHKQKIYNVYNLLLILFPSGLQIEGIVHFYDEDGFVQRQYMSNLETKYFDYDEYLTFDDEYLAEANEFINRVFKNIRYDNYIGLAIENYINSFNVSHLHFAYIALCMALENLVSGPQELSYRLKRGASIINGSTETKSEMIFSNLGKIYSLRSKIVHGESYKTQEIGTKIDYLRNLVSRNIIELLVHNIENVKELDSILTKLGYGQRDRISKGWNQFKINPVTFHDIYKEVH